MYIPSTLSELIEYGKNLDIAHRGFNSGAELHDASSDETIRIPFNPLINKYRDYFDAIMLTVPLNEEEQNDLRFSPKKLSYELYGTTEYWSMLLYINNCHSILDFEPEKVKVFDPDELQHLINELLIIEGNI